MEEGTGKGRPGRDVQAVPTRAIGLEGRYRGLCVQGWQPPRPRGRLQQRPRLQKILWSSLDKIKTAKEDGKGADARGEVADLQEPLDPKWLCQQSTDATTNCTGNWRNGCKPWPLVNKQIYVFPAVPVILYTSLQSINLKHSLHVALVFSNKSSAELSIRGKALTANKQNIISEIRQLKLPPKVKNLRKKLSAIELYYLLVDITSTGYHTIHWLIQHPQTQSNHCSVGHTA